MSHVLMLVPLLAGLTGADPEVAPPPGDAPKVELAPPVKQKVFLTVHSNRSDLLLIRKDNDQTVCTVPCNQRVASGPGDVYYLGGSGISPSSRFDLTEATRAARIDIRAGSRPAKIVGIVFTSVSVPALLSGAGNMLWYGVQQIPEVKNGMQGSGFSAFYNPVSTLVTALIELTVGAVLLTSGIILWSRNSTRMTLEPEDAPSGPDPEAAPLEKLAPAPTGS